MVVIPSVGGDVMVRFTGRLNSFNDSMVMIVASAVPCSTVKVSGSTLRLKSGVGSVISCMRPIISSTRAVRSAVYAGSIHSMMEAFMSFCSLFSAPS